MNLVIRHVYSYEDLEVGMEASFARTVCKADIIAFADLTGDKNPVHLDARYAAKTIFEKPIAHGMLTAGTHGTRAFSTAAHVPRVIAQVSR